MNLGRVFESEAAVHFTRQWTVGEAADWLDANGIDCNNIRARKVLDGLIVAGVLRDDR